MSSTNIEKVKKIIKKQRDVLLDIDSNSLDIRLPQWLDRTIRFLQDYIVSEELELLVSINTSSYEKDRSEYLAFLNQLTNDLDEFSEQYLIPKDILIDTTLKTSNSQIQTNVSNKVFIVHGHDSLAKIEVARTLEKLKLEAIVLHEQPNEGKTIVEKFEGNASQVGFAVVLLTPDDEGHPKNKPDSKKDRARQNVILELGYFSGVLGRSKVCVLYKGNIEIPSDYLGVVYVSMDEAGAWKFSLAKELKEAGLTIDLNDLV